MFVLCARSRFKFGLVFEKVEVLNCENMTCVYCRVIFVNNLAFGPKIDHQASVLMKFN